MCQSTNARYCLHSTYIIGILLLSAVLISPLSLSAQAKWIETEGLLSRLLANRPNNIKIAFTYSPRYPVVGQAVQFMNATTGNPSSWNWDFGDGVTSVEISPRHVYSKAGFKRVTLTVQSSTGSKKASRTLTVMPATLLASFAFSPTTPIVGQAVQFTDTSTGGPTSWQWTFGDGSTSTAQNPSHAFTTSGAKTVSLTVVNNSGSNTSTRTVNIATALTASFSFSPTTPIVGQAVQFTDTSTGGATSWQWSFGDGSTSTAQNPRHAFTTSGTKTVTLTVVNNSGSNTLTRTVNIATALTASFSFSPATPSVGQAVQFTDTSTGRPTSWQWSFGDGSTSAAQNPSHAFTTSGAKTVSLTVVNNSGSNTSTHTVNIATALTASFSFSPATPSVGQAVQFTDTSTGGPTSWQWSFGDGALSTVRNPIHSYSVTGSFEVSLAIGAGSDMGSTTRTIVVSQESPTYYVDTNSLTASDSNPGTADLPWKTIAKANQVLIAGDTVYIKAGTYNSAIAPENTGSKGKPITYCAFGSDAVTIRDTTYGIRISGKSYITVSGISCYNLDQFLYIENGASHNTIAFCKFDHGRGTGWNGSIIMGSSSYNWIHHCTFSNYGSLATSDFGAVLDIGSEEVSTDYSNYNLIENNALFHGGHHVLGVFGKFNVIRNNYIHNEIWSSGHGYRNVYFNGYVANSGWNLFEGNRIGYAGPNTQDRNSSGTALGSTHNIVRKNYFYHNDGSGLSMSVTSSYISDITYNKIYNNSFLHNGWDADNIPDAMTSAIGLAIYGGSWIIKYNAIKNNIYYDHYQAYGTYGPVSLNDQILAGNWDGDTLGNPLFVNSEAGDPSIGTLPDLRLLSGSPCIDRGIALTTITSSNGSGTAFVVADAGYFMDGWGIMGVEGDEIQVIGTTQVARITEVDYSTNMITVDRPIAWIQGQGLALSYTGTAPDSGAVEYGAPQTSIR